MQTPSKLYEYFYSFRMPLDATAACKYRPTNMRTQKSHTGTKDEQIRFD